MIRPREIFPEPEEVVELGKDLVQWALEPSEKPRTAWCLWYALKHGMQGKHWKALCSYPDFRGYYEIARAAMVERIQAQELEKGMSHRYASMYDRELYEFENEEADKNAARKKDSYGEVSESLSNMTRWLAQQEKKD